ncbi:MAG: hypothetical protein M0033_12360 [Nitrospiraceae bacterium]|nr:hypothetical protein [Nitrospiraceae bacterium]MDA8326992.1 hypothetical protein [Nitrospiraceae bacterium]
MMELTGKIVEVATAELVYTGRLAWVGEAEVWLESETGWVSVPLENIAFIREKEKDADSPF